ncbi:hypothetical protein [Actinomadura rupiterrae]|uniref:hypothetical protein n=1 Tax=Actinomadura rupiterrae TaxID=559627 RepID=UPI0020A31145|nr:hypothetical protein [Actinomadura rupiterrae]MCP2340845.1 hypothetical protein [Actinomadura rupiterrae]
MKRLFWLSVGAGAGVYASHRVKRRVERLAREWSPEGVAVRAVNAGQGAGRRLLDFAAEVKAETAAREQELREAVGLDGTLPGPEDPRPARRVLRARYTIVNDKDGH